MLDLRLATDFLERIRIEGDRNTPFTWLIGAGMSVSSNIPLASNVSWRIIIFEYLIKEGAKLWSNELSIPITYKDLDVFLDWYERAEDAESSVLQKLQDSALTWLNKKPEFQNTRPDDTNCYPLVFKHLFQSTTLHQTFLTKIIQRAKGINLAHLALAGILRDYPEFGHTVFTTNFDDLLLKAILSLNHTARVYGDLASKDKPTINPTYPQIVHLHGRHTGYKLVNTKEQLNAIDQPTKEGFWRHISNSHLIVVGYSGWDDFVMQTLQTWEQDGGLIKGDLFWIPYKSEKRILPEVQQFFSKCPPGRVHVIVNEQRDLDADSFMLSLAEAINSSMGGFGKYRTEILNNATKQHDFTLRQLVNYPDHDPNSAIASAEKLIADYHKNPSLNVVVRINAIEMMVSASDIPVQTKVKVYWLLALVEMMTRNFATALNYLTNCLALVGDAEASHDRSQKTFSSLIYRALGDCNMHLYEFEAAKRQLKSAYKLSNSIDDKLGASLAYVLLAEIALREGKTEKASQLLDVSTDQIISYGSSYVQGDFFQLRGDIKNADADYPAAKDYYQRAFATHESVSNSLGMATALRGLGGIAISLSLAGEGLDYYRRSEEIYVSIKDDNGIANLKQAYGDFYRRQENYDLASAKYLEAIHSYQNGSSLHGLCNAKLELLKLRVKMKSLGESDPTVSNKFFFKQDIDEISALCLKSKNAHALWQLKEMHFVDSTEPV